MDAGGEVTTCTCTTSSEAEALKNAFEYLIDSIDTDSLLPAALSRNLIREHQREDCSCESDRYKKAEKFIGHLLRAVNGDSNNFHVFIQVLFECDQPSIARRVHAEFVNSMAKQQSQPRNMPIMTEVKVPDELIRKLAGLRLAFSNFLCKYESELQKSDETQKKFIKILQMLHKKPDENLSFQKCFRKFIENEVSLFNIMHLYGRILQRFLPKCLHFFNCTIVDQYNQKLDYFMSGTRIDEFKALFPAPITSSTLSAEKIPIKLKLDRFWDDKTLDDLIQLVKLLGVLGNHLHLSKVEDGCIAVIWLCSTSHIKELIRKMHETADLLQLKGVLQVYAEEELKLELGTTEVMDQHQSEVGVHRHRRRTRASVERHDRYQINLCMMLFKCLITVILLYNRLISTAHASIDKSSFILNPIFEIHQLANWAMT